MPAYNPIPTSLLQNGTDLESDDYVAVLDVNDFTQAPQGSLVKYPLSDFQAFFSETIIGSNIESCYVATTGNLVATYNNGTNNNGIGATLTNDTTLAALVIDGITMAVGERVLVKNQSSGLQNGIYTVTVVGDASTAWVLTRASDYDSFIRNPSQGDFTAILFGTTNGLTFWILVTANPIVIGTTVMVWDEFLGGSVSVPLTVSEGGTGLTSVPAYQVLIGGTTSTNPLQTVTGTGTTGQILTSNGPGASPTWQPSGASSAFWQTISGTSQLAAVQTGYIPLNGALTSITLPAAAVVGSEISVLGHGAGGYIVDANVGQTIVYDATLSSTSGGSVSPAGTKDSITFVCTVANTEWTIFTYKSNLLTFA